jgi:hypothetical protein
MIKTIKQRIFFYSVLGMLCLIMPYVATVILTFITGDRITGLSYCFILSTVIIDFIFSFFFLKTKKILKYTLPLLTALISFFATMWIGMLGLFHLKLDTYGYYDMVLIHFVIATIIWEITYHILQIMSKNKINCNLND